MDKNQKQNNLPSLKQNSSPWLGNIIKRTKYFLQRGDSKNRKIVEQLQTISQYNEKKANGYKIHSTASLKYHGIGMKNGTVFSMDINDLYSANKYRSKESVNESINEILRQINEISDNYGIDNRLIAKMGDEIYMLAPNKTMEELSEFSSNLKQVSADGLSISVGASDDLSKGFESALNIADKKMGEYKSKWKAEVIQRDYGDSLDSIVEHLLSRQFEKMRIDLEKLREKNSDKNSLKNTFDTAIRSIKLEDILKGESRENKEEPSPTFELLIEKYEEEAKVVLGKNADPEKIKNYVLGNVLSKGRIDGSIKSEYFQKIGFKDTLNKAGNTKKVEVLSVGLSGLKGVNDAHGHEAGDRAIESALSYFQQVIDESGIENLSPIIEKSAGDSYVILKGVDESTREILKSKIEEYNQSNIYYLNEKENNNKIYMNCDFQELELNDIQNIKDEKSEQFLERVYSCIGKSEENIQEASLIRKINNVPEMKSSIIKIFRQVIDSSKELGQINEQTFAQVTDVLKTKLEDTLEEEQTKNPNNVIDFEAAKRDRDRNKGSKENITHNFENGR